MANAAFAIRLSVDGARQAGAELRGVPEDAAKGVKTFGDASDRAGRQSRGLRADVTSVTPAMRSLDTAVKGVRGEFENFAGRVPIVGGALQALGPAGVAAAAGVAAITIGFTQMLQLSRQAIQQLGDLKDAADNVALGVEDFQAFRGVALLEGINAQSVDSMLSTLAINSARASEGFGKMHAALQKVNPELAEQLALTTTQAQRLDILAKAVQSATSYNDKLNIAVAAFGSEGAQMIRVLDESGASMDTWRDRAQAAGLIVEESLVEAVDAIGKRMDVLEARTEVAGQRLGVALAPANEAIAETSANFMLGLTEIVDGLKDFEDRTSYSLAVTRNRLLERVKTGLVGIEPLDDFKRQIAEIEEILNRRIALAERMRMLENMALLPDSFDPTGEASMGFARQDFVVPPDPETAEQKKAREDAERKAAEAARTRAGYEREAIQIRAELGDITGLLAARQAELNTLIAAGVGITREMADEVMARYRASLDGTAAAQARINAILDDAKTPLDRVNDEIAALTAAWEASGGTLKGYGAALAALKSQQQDLVASTNDLGVAVNDNVAVFGELPDVIGRSNQQLGEMRRMSLEVEFGMAGIIGILDQQIETWEDAGQVALRVLRDIAVQAMYAAAQMQNANLGSILAAGFGVFMGGWGGGQGYVDPALGAYPSGPVDIAYQTGAYHHTGGIAGVTAAPTRRLPASLFADAPRNHRGYPLAADERAAILQVGEPVVSKWDANRIMGAVERSGGGAGSGVVVNFHNYTSGEVETQQRRGPGGEMELDVFIGRKINRHIAAGDADGAMAQRYGLARAVGGR